MSLSLLLWLFLLLLLLFWLRSLLTEVADCVSVSWWSCKENVEAACAIDSSSCAQYDSLSLCVIVRGRWDSAGC